MRKYQDRRYALVDDKSRVYCSSARTLHVDSDNVHCGKVSRNNLPMGLPVPPQRAVSTRVERGREEVM